MYQLALRMFILGKKLIKVHGISDCEISDLVLYGNFQ